MTSSLSQIDWINTQQQEMISLVHHWASINSGSDNLSGLALMLDALVKSFSILDGTMNLIDLPPRPFIDNHGAHISIPQGRALHITKRPHAPFRILFGGHMDTVYSASHPFQHVDIIDDIRMQGPGVADMKGGLAIMLMALRAFEQHAFAHKIGWEILITPDEETGSVSSEKIWRQCAQRTHLGLIFEPSYPDGSLVSARKGSCNMTVIATGKAAHAGRDIEKGKNAIVALARFITQANNLTDHDKGVSINIGHITGGGPVNIVPDHALCHLNARATTPEDFQELLLQLQRLIQESEEGTTLSLHMHHKRPPKPFDEATQQIFLQLKHCAQEEGEQLLCRPSGGVCDGNILADAGLPVIDSLGTIGGEIHTLNEYLLLDSLVKRARLVSRFLIHLTKGEPL